MSGLKRGTSEHPAQTKTPEAITYRLIREFKREPLNSKNTRNLIVWWVVQWCKSETAVLEKRRIYVSSKTGLLKTYKQMPWNLEDLKWMAINQNEIVEALQQ